MTWKGSLQCLKTSLKSSVFPCKHEKKEEKEIRTCIPESISLRARTMYFLISIAGQLFIILHKHSRSQQETSLLKLYAQKRSENMFHFVLKRLTSVTVLCNS